MARRINILGVTGSIGQSCVQIIKAHRDEFTVGLISAHLNKQSLEDIALDLGAAEAVLSSEIDLNDAIARHPADITVCGIVGMAGLEPLMAAMQNNQAIVLANKEPLVAAGPQVMKEAEELGCQILPADSEHNAVFQVYNPEQRSALSQIMITASGGPFWNTSKEEMDQAGVEQAIAHPTWSMGAKISVDSATMMNKALEVIEACILFDMPPEKIQVLVHPQSAVHGMAEYIDGSILCQMGPHDMCTPLTHSLFFPRRMSTPGQRLDLTKLSRLDFFVPDSERFPAIDFAYEALAKGQYACIALNAANEIAVEHFLARKIGFADIMDCVQAILSQAPKKDIEGLDGVFAYDKAMRDRAREYLGSRMAA